jgi:hypothetical protein
MDLWGRTRVHLFGLSDDEATFAKRGFAPGRAESRARLELAGTTFIHGYNAAIRGLTVAAASAELERCPLEVRGFAYEGAAMAYVLLDALVPVHAGRWRRLARGTGAAHLYMVHVGAGWALARLRRSLPRALDAFDPELRWLAADGYGFHQGYFAPGRFVAGRAIPRRVHGYALRAFDQGLGRSLWFSNCASPGLVAHAIDDFPPGRRSDLWSGVGLAAAYAGGCTRDALRELREAGAPYWGELAQGVAFAVKARARAGNPASHTHLACEVLTALQPHDAVAAVDAALELATERPDEPRYESWRVVTRRLLAGGEVRA